MNMISQLRQRVLRGDGTATITAQEFDQLQAEWITRAQMDYSPLPTVAPRGVLVSMAIRYDHGLGVPGYYDGLLGAGEHQKRMESTLRVMLQLYEEVSGAGFYSPDAEERYTAMAKDSLTAPPSIPE